MRLEKGGALIVVDVQNDFCSGGALPVPDGDKVVPVLNEYIRIFSRAGASIVATRDWHPADHISFKAQGGVWPPHCIQGTQGAAFHPDLALPKEAVIISKGDHPKKEAYSGFQGTDLAERLKREGIRTVYVGGLATDYCVKNTALDALKSGFETVFLEDASRGVEARPGDTEKAISEMKESGARPISIKALRASDIDAKL